MLIDAKHLTYNQNFHEYVQELSTLKGKIDSANEVGPMIPIPHQLILRNCPTPGQHRQFTLSSVDQAGDCVTGYRFIENDPNDHANPLAVLLIND